MDSETIKLAAIPLIAAVIGYCTNWVAIKLLFYPLRFWGVRIGAVQSLLPYLPRRLQQIPSVANGGIGWQGIIPSRAAKMGSIAVDKGIAKLGSPADFYQQLDPEKIAQHILTASRSDMRALVEEIVEREHPDLWADLPPQIKEAVHERVQANLPEIVEEVTDDLGRNIDQLLDIKLMVIRHIEAEPSLANRIFLDVGKRELNFVISSGAYFGFLLGLPEIALFAAVDAWWVLPLGGIVVGTLTNWMALKVIFEPLEPRKVGPFTIHGLFMRRQREVSDVYSRIIAEDVVTLRHMGDELLHGPSSDRMRQMIETRMGPAVDRALGVASSAVRVAVGTREYDAIRDSLAAGAVEYTMTPLSDPEFNREQSEAVRELIAERMLELPPADFAEMLRTAMREDEWMLILLGGQLGFLAGVLQIALVF